MNPPPSGPPGWGYPPPGYGPPPAYPPPGYRPPPTYDPPPAYPPPGYGPPPAYPPPGYGPPPAYPPPDYGPPPAYPPPGYGPPPAYPPPGYGPPAPAPLPPYGPPPTLQPGVIPLRPLSLIDIYSGAVGYIRANPKVTLGLTAIVVVATQILSMLIVAGLLAAAGGPRSAQPSGGALAAGVATGAIITSLGTIVAIGMLTVVIGRAVFGSTITIGEAWNTVRGRFPALLGLTGVVGLAATVLTGLVVLFVGAAAGAADAAGAVVVGLPLMLALIGLLAYGYTAVCFAATVIVLERLPVFAAIGRSYRLVRANFWRVLGILALTALIAYLVTSAVALPFNIVGLLVNHGHPMAAAQPSLWAHIGTMIGQIIVLPFTAGVVVLLYTDRRIRSESFDLLLRSSATAGPPIGWSTDRLWLTRPPD